MKKILAILFGLYTLATAPANATSDFSFTGNLANSDDVQLVNFTVDEDDSYVTLRTWSYAGGTNAEGVYISAGGFDTVLNLFDSEGYWLEQIDDDDADSGNVLPDPDTGDAYDSFLSLFLDAGDYSVSIMQYGNWLIGPMLADGFDGSDIDDFVDVYTGNTRTSFWALDILNVDSANAANVPEPEMLALFGLGFGGLAFSRRRCKA